VRAATPVESITAFGLSLWWLRFRERSKKSHERDFDDENGRAGLVFFLFFNDGATASTA
jgi:hypothetical protein